MDIKAIMERLATAESKLETVETVIIYLKEVNMQHIDTISALHPTIVVGAVMA